DRITVPSQFLRGVRGIDFRCGSSCIPVARNFVSCLWLFVDGSQRGQVKGIDSLGLTPSSIAAIEGYDRSGIVPTEFQGTLPVKQGRGFSPTAGCGAVAVWTKTHVAR